MAQAGGLRHAAEERFLDFTPGRSVSKFDSVRCDGSYLYAQDLGDLHR